MSDFGTFTDVRDGKTYRIRKIREQTWFAENFAYIPHVSPGPVQGGIWVYGYNGCDVDEAISTENYKKYGCLYDWDTAMKVSPNGWHLPSNEDWGELTRYYGNHMIGVDTGYWKNWHSNSDNSSGFSALPGGQRTPEGLFDWGGEFANFWSSMEQGGGEFWYWYLHGNNLYARTNPEKNTYGYSIRYIKDE